MAYSPLATRSLNRRLDAAIIIEYGSHRAGRTAPHALPCMKVGKGEEHRQYHGEDSQAEEALSR